MPSTAVVPISREEIRRQAVFWLGTLAAFGGYLYLFSSVLLPFVLGMVVAYFLDPVAGFIRGRGSLCLILGVYYAVGLSFAGLNFGLLIGFFAGMISFIPYVGSLVGLTLGLSVAVVQFWGDGLWASVGIVFAVFATGQFVEGNILQPRLVGQSVGLHPVWLMFALFAFGALFGFVGMMVAVPAAAVVGVLVRYALSRYLLSDIYAGTAATKERTTT